MVYLHSLIDRQIVLPITICMTLSGCFAPSDEASRVRAAMSAMSKAAEHKDSRVLMAYLSADFVAQQAWRKPQMLGLVYGYFQQYPVITVTLMDMTVSVQGDTAESHCKLLLTGSEQVLPERLRWLELELHWVKVASEWKIRTAQWRDVGSDLPVSGT